MFYCYNMFIEILECVNIFLVEYPIFTFIKQFKLRKVKLNKFRKIIEKKNISF